MKKKKSLVPKKKKRSPILFYVLLPLIAVSIVLYSLGQQYFFNSNAQGGQVFMLLPNPDIARPNLQLLTMPFITLAPKPPITQKTPTIPATPANPVNPPAGGYCGLDVVKPQGSSCSCLDTNAIACPASNAPAVGIPSCSEGFAMRLPPGVGSWYCVTLGQPGLIEPNPPAPPSGCFAACIAKPLVYLYPTETTSVDVSVKVPGKIFISDPLYPEGGWKDVEAHPDGTLYYNGAKYGALFYESNVTKKIGMPKTGFVIARGEIASKLDAYITRLGLIGREKKEFLEYWVPMLQNLNSPYVFFSILPEDVKTAVDQVIVSPEPDTRIEFIAYFKPLQKTIDVQPLDLPSTPPERKGFTEIEWGGTIAQ